HDDIATEFELYGLSIKIQTGLTVDFPVHLITVEREFRLVVFTLDLKPTLACDGQAVITPPFSHCRRSQAVDLLRKRSFNAEFALLLRPCRGFEFHSQAAFEGVSHIQQQCDALRL